MPTALIFGVGRTGGYVAARAAVHGLDVVLVDDDRFEAHNFEGEHLLRDSRFIGTLKVFTLSRILNREFPNQSFRGIARNVYELRREQLVELVSRADLVLACTGNPETNKYICTVAGTKPVIVTGVFADDDDLRGFVFVSRADSMCLGCWDNRREVAGRVPGEPYNFRQTAASAVDIGVRVSNGDVPPQMCVLLRGRGESATDFRWVRGERNPDCPFHSRPRRRTSALTPTQSLVTRRRAPKPSRLSPLRVLQVLLLWIALGDGMTHLLTSSIAAAAQWIGQLLGGG